MHIRIAQCLDAFDPINLEALNSKAAMLERLDNKYIVPADRLLPAFETFRESFDVLEIGERRTFTYATDYFDDPERRAYLDHHQGRRKRCKVRIRHYVDAGLSFLEVKLKDRRDVTVKKRLRMERPQGRLCDRSLRFVEDCHEEMYGRPFGRTLAPAISMEYRRITLVAKEGGERMTIDTRLSFQAANRHRDAPADMFILETKSARGNGLADKVLRSHHLHPTKQCSKYCIGMAALGQVMRRNRFLPALKRLSLHGAAPDALVPFAEAA